MDYEEIEAANFQSVADLDAALLRPCSMELRAELMARRITLDQAARAAPQLAPLNTGFTVRIPLNLGITDVVDQNGQKYQARSVGDHRVIDMTPAVFRILLAGPHGLDWQNAQDSNVWERMQPGIHV